MVFLLVNKMALSIQDNELRYCNHFCYGFLYIDIFTQHLQISTDDMKIKCEVFTTEFTVKC